jgi:membrane-bound metal-dependent hydrolase YbcI (DUF457 family)
MFIGHYAVGFATKKVATKPSLGTYFAAVSLLDILFPIFMLVGLESAKIEPGNTVVVPMAFDNYPYSHSLFMTLVWATLFAGIYFLFRRDIRSSLWLWIAVTSHWLLDALSHRPDMPLAPWSDSVIGLGLWNSLAGTIIVEGAMFIVGVILYLNATKAKDKTGVFAFWALVLVLALSYISNIFGPPPPNIKVMIWFAPFSYIFIFWGYWIDRHRELKHK